jgi:hypothetical protein
VSEGSENSIIKTSEYAYTANEQVQMWRETMVRWVDYIFVVVTFGGIAAVVGWLPVVSRLVHRDVLNFLLGFVIALPLILPLLIGIIYPFWRTRRIRRRHAALEASGKLVSQWHEFDGRFVTTHLSDGQEHRIDLYDFVTYVVTNGMMYLYLGPKNYLAIPVRAFPQTGDLQALYTMFEANEVVQRFKHPKVGWA